MIARSRHGNIPTLAVAMAVAALAVAAGQALAAAGALDTSFSDDGKRTEAFDSGDDRAESVAIDSQNRVVVAGSSEQPGGTGTDFAIARYTPSGELDTSFSGDGKRVQSFGNAAEQDLAMGVAIDSQDRIVVAGRSDQDTAAFNWEFAIARYTQSGALDTSFSGDGKRLQNFAVAPNGDQANDVAIDSQGRIVVAGWSEVPGAAEDFAVARFKENGALDTSFSGDGKRLQNFGSAYEQANDVAVDSRDRVVALGWSEQSGGTGTDVAIARYQESGALDTSFSSDGKRVQNFVAGDNLDLGNSVAIDSQDRVVALARSDQDAGGGFQADFALARFTSSGSLDPSFSGDGKHTEEFTAGDADERANALAIDSADRIVAVGATDLDPAGTVNQDFVIARYTAGGALDTSFSGDGKRLQNFDDVGGSDVANAVTIDSQGRIIATGRASFGVIDFATARFLGS